MAYPRVTVAERSAGTHKFPFRSITFGALGAAGALALDQTKSRLGQSRRSQEPEFIVREHPGDQAIFVLPGCRTDARSIVDLLDPKLSQFGTTVFTAYPQKGFSLDAVGQGLIRAREQTGKDRVSVLAISMGGMVLSRLGTDTGFRQAFGPIDTLVLDSALATGSHLKPKMRHLLEIARTTRHSFVVGKLAPLIMAHLERDELADHEAGLDNTLIHKYFDSSTKTALRVIGEQGDVILGQDNMPPDGVLAGWVNNIRYVRSANDSVVDTSASIPAYAAMFGQSVEDILDGDRPPTSHAMAPQYPTFIGQLFTQEALVAA